jgi:predicted MPP superfamily phosphohydrolase
MIAMLLREEISLLLVGLLILALYGLELVLLVSYILVWIRRGSWRSIRIRRFDIVLHALAVTGILCMLYGHFIESRWIEVNTITIPTPKLVGSTFRIVQVSDLHCDSTPGNEERAVKIINQLKPDVVVATGDYLNRPSALPRLQDMLRRLDAPLGKFAIRGSFERRARSHLDLLQDTGFRWLEHETVTVQKGGDVIDICGLGLDEAEACRDLLQGTAPARFRVFLFHTPDLVEDVNGLGVDLYLCGHTHGGQVALPWYGAIITLSKFGKKYESGLYRVGGTMLYVNRGLGMERAPAPRVRFFARPEIAIFDIAPEGLSR